MSKTDPASYFVSPSPSLSLSLSLVIASEQFVQSVLGDKSSRFLAKKSRIAPRNLVNWPWLSHDRRAAALAPQRHGEISKNREIEHTLPLVLTRNLSHTHTRYSVIHTHTCYSMIHTHKHTHATV